MRASRRASTLGFERQTRCSCRQPHPVRAALRDDSPRDLRHVSAAARSWPLRRRPRLLHSRGGLSPRPPFGLAGLSIHPGEGRPSLGRETRFTGAPRLTRTGTPLLGEPPPAGRAASKAPGLACRQNPGAVASSRRREEASGAPPLFALVHLRPASRSRVVGPAAERAPAATAGVARSLADDSNKAASTRATCGTFVTAFPGCRRFPCSKLPPSGVGASSVASDCTPCGTDDRLRRAAQRRAPEVAPRRHRPRADREDHRCGVRTQTNR